MESASTTQSTQCFYDKILIKIRDRRVLPQKHKCFRGPRGFLYLGDSHAVSVARANESHKAH